MAKKAKNEIDVIDQFEMMRKKFFDEFWDPIDFNQIKMSEVRTPLVNVKSKGKNVVVTAEMPGVTKNDLEVDADEEYIKIRAGVEQVNEKEKKDFHKYERKYSSFSRVIPMPEKIVPGKVKGELKDGVLTLTVPKAKVSKKKKSKRVKIK